MRLLVLENACLLHKAYSSSALYKLVSKLEMSTSLSLRRVRILSFPYGCDYTYGDLQISTSTASIPILPVLLEIHGRQLGSAEGSRCYA